MRRAPLAWMIVIAGGCGLPECEELCQANAECLDREVADYTTTWSEWTGYSSREAYEADCYAVFEQSFEGGAAGADLRETCRTELDAGVCSEP